MTHDYKAALEWFNRAKWDERASEIHAIRFALALADKVTGETSSRMDTIAEAVFEDRVGHEHDIKFYDHAEAIFKAMIAQALKEISDGK